MNTVFDTIIGLNKLRKFFPDNFNIIEECLHNSISIIRLVHLKRDPENVSSIIHEVVRSSFRKVFQEKFGLVLAYYDKKDDCICFNADLDRGQVANELNKQLNINIKPDEVYCWIFYHEVGHKLGMGEIGADAYACKLFLEWRKTIDPLL